MKHPLEDCSPLSFWLIWSVGALTGALVYSIYLKIREGVQ